MTKEQETLVLENRKLVHSAIYKYKHLFGKNSIYDYEDLEQIGYTGLVKAANTYDPNTNLTFSNYAYVCIRNELITAATDEVKKNGMTFPFGDDIPVGEIDVREVESNVMYSDLISVLHEIKKDFCKTLQFGVDAIIFHALGQPVSEIAEKFGVKAPQLYTYIKRAKQAIIADPRFVVYVKEAKFKLEEN